MREAVDGEVLALADAVLLSAERDDGKHWRAFDRLAREGNAATQRPQKGSIPDARESAVGFHPMSALGESSLPAGRAALVRAAWAEARSCFEAALADGETIEALEGLGVAARWQMDGPTALAAHERAYRLARESGDGAASARLAIELAFDCAQFRGARRDERLARTGGPPARAACRRAPSTRCSPTRRANRALNGEHDPAEARRHAAARRRGGRRGAGRSTTR